MSSRDIANLKQGLVAAWIPSLGSTGYRLVDRVGSNHGVLTGMDASDWVVSGGAGSLDFDGTDDFASLSPVQNTSGNLTVSAFAKSDIGGSNVHAVIADSDASGSILPFQLELFQASWGFIWGSNPYARFRSSSTITIGQWYHTALVRQGQVGAWSYWFYIDGKLDFSGTTTVNPASAQGTAIGRNGLRNSQYFDGQLDDIRIYNRALSATEVSLLSKERGIGFKTSSRTSSVFAKRYAYKPPKDKTYAAITRSQSDYDSLREGLVLAICPSVSGATGYRAVDVSGKNNHGTLQNMTPEDWVSSNGLALDFDKVNDFVDLGKKFSGAKITVSGWARPTFAYTATDFPSIIGALNNAGTQGWNLYYGTNLDEWTWYIGTDGTSGVAKSAVISTDAALGRNVWQHFCGTFDGVTARLFINGIQVGSGAATGNYQASVSDVRIGHNQDFTGIFAGWEGQLDDIRIYNRALTEPEIRRLASGRGVGLKPTSTQFDYIETREKTYSVIVKSQQEHSSLSEGLVGAWCPSLGASGYRLVDRSGYGNHGVLTGMDAATDWVASNGVALDFENLSDDRVSCSSANISMAEGAISLWCRKVAATADDNDYMLWMHFTSVTDRLYLEIQTYLVGGNKNAKFLATFNNSLSNYAVGTTINLNQWYHALVQWKNGFPIEIYIDGRFVSSSSTNYTTNATTTSEFIGNDHANLVGFGGYIDDFRRYTRRLTPSEIRLLASKRGIGLRSQKQTMFYQFPSGSKRRRILTGMT